MAGKRVHELAKEYGLSSKELLGRLSEINEHLSPEERIEFKSHASMLSNENIQTIAKYLSTEVNVSKDGEQDEDKHESLISQEDDKKRSDEETARRAAVEEEWARREAERARRHIPNQKAETDSVDIPSEVGKAVPAHTESSFKDLERQIDNEAARQRREKEQERLRLQNEAREREVAKKQAVEDSLRRKGKKSEKPAGSVDDSKQAPCVLKSSVSSGFSSLLDQIESEKRRIAEEQQKQAEKAAHQTTEATGQSANPAKKGQKNRNNAKRGRQKKDSGPLEPSVPELEQEVGQDGDRYAQMAIQAEKLQRDKVLAEARAAVAAASQEGEGRRKKRKEKREAEARERAELDALEKGLDPTLVLDDSVVEIPQGVTVGKFAELINVPSNDVIKRLFLLGQALTLTQMMNDEMVELIADDLGRKVRVVSPEEEYAVVYHDSDADLLPRSPVVTVMGHVDHGKTSLLDAIRNTGVALGEAGGITQHIGASVVSIGNHKITFIDTPGHEAFTAMRARGAQVTDVIVLVVAADDGVMPQTIEAINHAKAADVPIVVAVNKIDKPGANPDKVRQELTEYGVVPEEWGGTNMFVNVSAKQRLHIDDLLETIILQADVLELKANPNAFASGYVIEANLDQGRGPVATVLVQRGTLRPGDTVVAGMSYGRVRALINPHGEHAPEALPADPVEILGLNKVPTAGDEFRVFEDERDARKLAEERSFRARLAAQETKSHMNLDDLFERIEEGKQTDLNLIVKADVQGSIEALRDAFDKMDQSEVRINIVHSAVGGITDTDVTLATASDAIIIGFNVRPTGKSRQLAEKECVDIRLYRVIYQAIEDINAARVGLLSPDIVEQDTGIAEVRETFKVPKIGTIAGCQVIEGEINRNDSVRIVRDGTVVFEGTIMSLRRFKDDVKSVKQGYECGIGITGYQDIKVGDTIEGFVTKEVERTE